MTEAEFLEHTRVELKDFDEAKFLDAAFDLASEVLRHVRKYKTDKKMPLTAEIASISVTGDFVRLMLFQSVSRDVMDACKIKDVLYFLSDEKDEAQSLAISIV